MALESACIPLPSEIIMPFSGFLISQQLLHFWLTNFIASLGCLFGSVIAYTLGYYGGENVVREIIKKYGKYLLVFEYDFDEAQEWFKKHGDIIAFSSRLLPVIRTFISLPAGIAKMNFKKFVFYTFVGSFIWSTVLSWLGVKLGENWHTLGNYFHKFDIFIVIIGFVLIFLYIKHKLKKHKQFKIRQKSF